MAKFPTILGVPWPTIRDLILFFGGLGGVFNEAVLRTGAERPTLLFLFGAMMGLPAFLRKDEKKEED
jgi:hypothetical protein